MAANTLDAAAAEALELGKTVRVAYADGYTHRLRLEPPSMGRRSSLASHTCQDLLSELVRRPVDVLAAADVGRAEALVRETAETHGAPRAWTDENEWLRWLMRPVERRSGAGLGHVRRHRRQ